MQQHGYEELPLSFLMHFRERYLNLVLAPRAVYVLVWHHDDDARRPGDARHYVLAYVDAHLEVTFVYAQPVVPPHLKLLPQKTRSHVVAWTKSF